MQRQTVREPAVAGAFYPNNAADLNAVLDKLLTEAQAFSNKQQTHTQAPKALIVPHAGYFFSGLPAAIAYRLIEPFKTEFNHVVLFGPAHRVYCESMALPAHNYFNTPLGNLPINTTLRDSLSQLNDVEIRDDIHQQEHALEVHLPFIQRCLDQVSITPIVVGNVTGQACSQLIKQCLQEPSTLLIFSTDMSHFLSYDEAVEKDQATNDAIVSLSPTPLQGDQACGCHPLNGLIETARELNWSITNLHLCNSGDVSGDRSKVVGYGAWRVDIADGN